MGLWEPWKENGYVRDGIAIDGRMPDLLPTYLGAQILEKVA